MQRARPGNPVDLEEQRAAALTKAALQAAQFLGLSPAETAAVLGVAQGAVAPLRQGKRAVDGTNGEAERADALVRIVKRLHALLGPEETRWRSWLRREHAGTGGKPLDKMQQRDGVLEVARTLENAGSLD